MRQYCDSQPANGSSTNIRVIASIASSHMPRFSVRRTPNPPSSAADDDSPVPNSTRPPETMSSEAIRSATRAGWFTSGGICTIPCPSRIRLVRCEAAASTTSGAEECEYSSMKWCSTNQTTSKPARSATSICSSASSNKRRSEPASHGRGSCSS